ncbi:MAG: Acylamino-acid-releasing enzyme [uncultured Thermomicrobiales bacterium]|uniref:Acylamino-acid-releasing enzyme n=1 Tax=uncultured Thermomicrobiales bacterium TaxID=1645740 RepID=A0A6J4UGY5_9BACT|nr:MAG: Acylamino-acid-releasing enzyme [uncultured Thermomicrobiales bacterium]
MTASVDTAVGRPLVAEDLFKLRMVGDPRPSPDGRHVAYVVTRLDEEEDAYRAALWLVPSDGGAPTQLTAGTHRDTTPRWSPDGETLAFVSNRPGDPPPPDPDAEAKAKRAKGKAAKKQAEGDDKPLNQIWLIRPGGGEARQLTRQRHGASAPEWSPDGQTVAFLAPTEIDNPPGGAPADGRTVADERLIERIAYRFDGRGYLDRPNKLWAIPVDGGEARRLTDGDADDAQHAWSPDGARIVFVSNRTPLPERDTNRVSALYDVPAAGGAVRCLTEGEVDFAAPVWSPDGSRIAFLGHTEPAAGGSRDARLWTVPAGGGDPTEHTAAWGRSFGDFGMSDVTTGADQRPVWAADGATISALASDQGATNLYRVALDSGEVRPVVAGPRRLIAAQPLAGGGFVVLAGDAASPFELFVAGADGAPERRLSDHNQAFVDEVALAPAAEIRFPSQGDGQEIQGWILTPPGFDPGSGVKLPLIVQIHGGPHAMYGQALFHEMQLMAARGYAVAFCNPRGSAGYGEAFTGCTRGVWGEADAPDVLGLLDAVLERGSVDPARVGVTGGSYGGYLTNWLIGHSDRFRAAVTQRCVANFHSFYGTSDIGATFGEFEFGGTPWADTETLLKHSPISYVEQMTTPLLIVHNEQDLRCPIEQAEQLFVSLKRLGREVAFVRIPGEDHNLSRTGTPSRRLARLHHMIGWFDRHL